jgi:hypothetical protein
MPTLSISSEQVCYLIVKMREFDVQDIDTDPDDSSNPSDDRMISVLEDHAAGYLLGQPQASDYLGEGLSQFGFSCAEFEIGRL